MIRFVFSCNASIASAAGFSCGLFLSYLTGSIRRYALASYVCSITLAIEVGGWTTSVSSGE